mmetsp:Transcript_136140/g.435478  ORF Transcript_136140/g.435478 Transcript_136140/m.435478 type:complete len:201 (-) Transcript_136140:727-1329(-)
MQRGRAAVRKRPHGQGHRHPQGTVQQDPQCVHIANIGRRQSGQQGEGFRCAREYYALPPAVGRPQRGADEPHDQCLAHRANGLTLCRRHTSWIYGRGLHFEGARSALGAAGCCDHPCADHPRHRDLACLHRALPVHHAELRLDAPTHLRLLPAGLRHDCGPIRADVAREAAHLVSGSAGVDDYECGVGGSRRSPYLFHVP